jgi:tetratricopeptide (TPR) repeat protein
LLAAGASAKLGRTAKDAKPMLGILPCLLSLVLPAQPAAVSGAAQALAMPEYARAFHRGDYAGAMALAAERLKAQPGDVQARIVLARVEAARGRFQEAYTGFRKALDLDPRSADALYYVGITAGVLAQAEYERLFALAPGSARAHQLLGQSYQAQGRTAEAEAELKAALEAGPPTAEVQTALGDIARRSRLDFAGARTYYSRAIELAPGSYEALYGIGVCDSYAGEHARAIESFRRALRIAPSSAPARLALGISLLQTGEAAAAVTELERAAKLEPRMRQAYYQLGRAYQILGRSQEAEAAFARVQELIQQERQGGLDIIDPGANPQP